MKSKKRAPSDWYSVLTPRTPASTSFRSYIAMTSSHDPFPLPTNKTTQRQSAGIRSTQQLLWLLAPTWDLQPLICTLQNSQMTVIVFILPWRIKVASQCSYSTTASSSAARAIGTL
jgi:hypothetical protein